MVEFIFSETFITSSIVFSLPILFAALAALISNKANILNINIEGSMSIAALTGALTSYYFDSWIIGLVCAVLIGVVMSLCLAMATFKLKADSMLTGIALNTFATGATVFTLYQFLGVKGDSSMAPSVVIPNLEIPILSSIPIVGEIVFSQNILFYLAVLVAISFKLLLDKTKLGLYIKAVGYNEAAAKSVGIHPKQIKTIALVFCGICAGLGGAYLSMVYLPYFSAGMVGGRGFIGIAAEAMGGGMPGFTVLFAFLFGAVDYFSVGAQAVLGIPYELLNTLPYIMTVVSLIVYSIIVERSKRVSKKHD